MILKIKKKQWFNEPVQIVDDVKNIHSCIVSTCQRHHHYGFKFACFWCKITYKKTPIHCPIRFHPAQIEKRLPIKTGEGDYCIKGNVEDNVEIQKIGNSYFEVDGSFCSPSCCLAYIHEKQETGFKSKYNDSQMLLHQMTETDEIIPSPSWRLRDVYGGPYNKTEYQMLIQNKDTFQYHSEMLFINHMFEKNLFQ